MKIETWRELSMAYIEASKNNKGVDEIGNKKFISVESLKSYFKFHLDGSLFIVRGEKLAEDLGFIETIEDE